MVPTKPAADLLKSFVGLDVFLLVEERVEQRSLRHAEAEDAVDFPTEIGERGVALNPCARGFRITPIGS